jgi:hypothetical protein
MQEALPIVTSEIGDTWIYGLQADPKKTKAVRLMLRERARAIKVRPLSLFLSLSLSRARSLLVCFKCCQRKARLFAKTGSGQTSNSN